MLAGYTDADLGETDSLKVVNLIARDDSGNNLLGKDDQGNDISRFTPDDTTNPTKWNLMFPITLTAMLM